MFNYDNAFFHCVNKIIDVIVLGLLWLIFSIPLVTCGAATSALYYTANKVIRHDRGYVWREFSGAFKSNFKQATGLWLIYMICAAVLEVDIRVMSGYTQTGRYLNVLFVAVFAVITVVVLYTLMYISRFTQKLRQAVINSAVLAVSQLPRTLLFIVVIAGTAVVVYYLPGLIFIAPGCMGLLTGFVLEPVFRAHMRPEDRALEDKKNHPEQFS